MADKEKQTEGVISSLLQGMESIITAKTVVGDPIVTGDTTIIPLVDMSFGVAVGNGANDNKHSQNGGGGLGGKLTPSALLIIHGDSTRLVSVKNQDSLTKVLDAIPELVARFSKPKEGEVTAQEAKDIAFPDVDED